MIFRKSTRGLLRDPAEVSVSRQIHSHELQDVTGVVKLTAGPTWGAGNGTPEGSITATVGSIYSQTDSTTKSFFVKESGTGSTGWVTLASWLATRTDAPSTWFEAARQTIRVLNYATAGDGGGGLYKRVSSQPIYAGSYIRTADRFLPNGSTDSVNGGYWQYVPEGIGVNVRAFGAVADGVSGVNRVFSGTDNWQAIQNALDFAFYSQKCPAYVPSGNYRITNTLQLTYGDTFRNAILIGDGPKYAAESTFIGTAILCDFSDRPGLAVNGARNTRVRGITLMGNNFHYLEANGHGHYTPTVDDTVEANWIDPALSATANGRYTPYAAVAIDPYAGTKPASAYPDVPLPSWLSVQTQYNKALSSDVRFEDCWFGGFVVGVAIQPCDNDGNGDFIRLTRSTIRNCVYGISAGNTQGRVCVIRDSSVSMVHSGVVDSVHGRRQGSIELVSDGTDWEQLINIINITDSSIAGPFHFKGGYSESIWRIGKWGGGSSQNTGLIFESWKFGFSIQNDYRGWPATVLDYGSSAAIMFKSCSFNQYKLMGTYGGEAIAYMFDNCKTENNGTETLKYRQLAMNFLGGGWMFPPNAYDKRPERYSMNCNVYNIDTGGVTATGTKSYSLTNRQQTICAWNRRLVPTSQPALTWDAPSLWNALAKTSSQLTSSSLSGTTLTLTFNTANRLAYVFARNGPLPGDVVWDDQTGATFFVRSYDSNTGICLAELQNGYKITGGTFNASGNSTGGGTVALQTGLSISLSSGNWYFGVSRVYAPEYYLRGDTTIGNATITNVGRDDGYAAFIDTVANGGDDQILVGDYVYVDDLSDRWLSPTAALIAGVSGSAKTITVSGGAALATSRHQLKWFLRQPPSNI